MIAGSDRTFQRKHTVHILFDQRGERAQFIKRQFGNIAFPVHAETNGARNCFVRIAKRQAFFHEVVGQVGRCRKSQQRRIAHRVWFVRDAARHVGGGARRGGGGGGGGGRRRRGGRGGGGGGQR